MIDMMTVMEVKMNVYQKLNEVRKKIDYIKKDKQVQNYRAVTHDQITALVRPHLVEFGIVICPNLISSITVDSGEKTSKGTPIIRVEAVYEFTIVNIDDGTDSFKTSISAHANDTGDKAPGKALSYAKKALVLKLFEIETGEDEESRYQDKEEFNISIWSQLITDSQTIEGLEKTYLEAKALCLKLGDASAMKAVNAVTTKRKSELSAS
jgi:hypothetical protein